MSERKRLQPSPPVGEAEPKRKAPELDMCSNFFVEVVNPAFDPNRVLLRRVFFINEEKTRYVSVGYYPTRKYQPLVEFGGSKIKPVIIDPQHVETMVACLPRICEAMCDNGQFSWSDGAFRLNTVGSSRVARLYVETIHNLKISRIALLAKYVLYCTEAIQFIHHGFTYHDICNFCTEFRYVCGTASYC